jgi:NAD(P)H-dependent flavin oxidoreductase YrpB (nitropropane dioxygenase family)
MSVKNFFPTCLPIVCVSMRGISDVNFALVAAQSNVVSSIATNNYIDENTDTINISLLEDELVIFKKYFNDKNIIITIQEHRLEQNGIIDLIIKYATHCEILSRNISNLIRKNNFDRLTSAGIKLIGKAVNFSDNFDLYDGIIFKGKNAAGRIDTSNNDNLEDIVKKFVDMYPNKAIIPCGGIGNKQQIENLLKLGATAVGIGTLFAFSSESIISTETKEKIINSKEKDISLIDSNNLKQNAIVFSEWKGENDGNNTQSLKAGILNSSHGHIFVGSAINNINSIKPFQTIVNELIN